MIDHLRKGNVRVVRKLERLFRSLRDVRTITERSQEAKAIFRCLHDDADNRIIREKIRAGHPARENAHGDLNPPETNASAADETAATGRRWRRRRFRARKLQRIRLESTTFTSRRSQRLFYDQAAKPLVNANVGLLPVHNGLRSSTALHRCRRRGLVQFSPVRHEHVDCPAVKLGKLQDTYARASSGLYDLLQV